MLEVETERLLGPLNDIESKNAPKSLWLDGDTSLLTTGLRVSVVGSRKASSDGLRRAAALSRALAKRNITVVSGLAEGIDTVAHETAIASGGKTIAVLGTPVSEAYPKSNTKLLDTIKSEHLAVSQFPEGSTFRPQNFPIRNRTMALVSDATVIVEATDKSGTRHQGWEAIKMGRLLFLMQNVVDDKSISWSEKMIEYGAQVLSRETLDDALENIPPMTTGGEFAF